MALLLLENCHLWHTVQSGSLQLRNFKFLNENGYVLVYSGSCPSTAPTPKGREAHILEASEEIVPFIRGCL